MKFTGVKLSGVTVGGLDADYKVWLNRLTTLTYTHPNSVWQKKGSDLIKYLKSTNDWQELDVLYLFAINDSLVATVNMVTPSLHQAQRFNSPIFNAFQGYSTNGTTSSLSSYNPFTDGVKYTQNSASMGVHMHTGGEGGSTNRWLLAGFSGTTFTYLLERGASSLVSSRLNQGATNNDFSGITSFESGKSYGVNRTGSGNQNQYVDGVSVGTPTTASNGVPDYNFEILRLTSAGFGLSAWKVAAVWFGSGNLNQANMHTALTNYMS
jgi:hypothetical protein